MLGWTHRKKVEKHDTQNKNFKAIKLGQISGVPKLNSMPDAETYIGMFKIPAQLVFDSGGS